MLVPFTRVVTLETASDTNFYFGLFLGTRGPFSEMTANSEEDFIDQLLRGYPTLRETLYVRMAYQLHPTSRALRFHGANLTLKRLSGSISEVEDQALLIFRTKSGVVCGLCRVLAQATPEFVLVYLDDDATLYT
jgi:hypothetical protein